MSVNFSYGQRARDLVMELKDGSETTPVYNEEGVRGVLSETNALAREIEAINAEETDEDTNKAALVVFTMAIERNRRCLLAYQ